MRDLPIFPSFHPATVKQGLSFEERLRLARDAGFRATALDVNGALDYEERHGPGSAAGLLRSHGLQPAGWGGCPPVFGSEAEFARGLGELDRKTSLAMELGAMNCAVFVPNRTDMPRAEALKLAGARLRVAAEALARHGARLGIEFCGPNMFAAKPHEFVTGVQGTMRLAAASGAANVGLLADSFHLFCSGSQPADIDRFATGKVFAVHINDAPHGDLGALLDPDRVMPGDGVIPLGDFVRALVRAGYDGPAEVELFNPHYRNADPLVVATEAREKAERVISAALA